MLLKKGLSLDRYILEGYFFTQPSEGRDEVVLLGTRPGGELTYAGRVRVTQRELTFTLRSVETRYAPAIDVEGRYDPRKRSWEFTKALTSAQVAAKERKVGTPRRASQSFG